jgi:AraC-like DNA-binding protein
LKNRNNLQQYFYNEITLNKQTLKISAKHKEFIEKCIGIVEQHLDNDDFNIKILASEMGMSHSVVYRKVKAISGQSVRDFIRFIRLRKAAMLFINTDQNVNEVATEVGIYDLKYFRENFNKVFGMNPSEYIKKYRKSFSDKFNVTKEGS